jgi:hypothetical protein
MHKLLNYIVIDQKVPKLDISWLDCIQGQGTNNVPAVPHYYIALSFRTPSLLERSILVGRYRTALPTCTPLNETYEIMLA